VNFDGLLTQDWTVPLKKVTDGLSKTFLIGERTYQIRAWMIGSYWNGNTDPPMGRNATTPKGPQPSSAMFAMKNITDKFGINHDPHVGCYIDHQNDKGDRPAVADTTPRVISVNDLPFASFHPGGAMFSFGDGGVKFIPNDISTTVYLALASRNGGEAEGL
jgi:prepilin-type processing-associated H-X9-DG protein